MSMFESGRCKSSLEEGFPREEVAEGLKRFLGEVVPWEGRLVGCSVFVDGSQKGFETPFREELIGFRKESGPLSGRYFKGLEKNKHYKKLGFL